jgi:hypothetical protein
MTLTSTTPSALRVALVITTSSLRITQKSVTVKGNATGLKISMVQVIEDHQSEGQGMQVGFVEQRGAHFHGSVSDVKVEGSQRICVGRVEK